MRQFIGIFGRMFKVLMITALLVPALATSAIAYWTITDLGTLGAAGSEAYGINDIGQVTGESYIFGPVDDHAFIYTLATGMQDLETLGGNFSAGSGINNSGQVTGGSTTAGGVTHAFLYSATTGMIDLGTLGGSGFTMGNSINDSGQVTGGSTTAGGNTHAFLYSVTTGIIDLGTLGGSDSAGICINNLGQVAGWSNTAGGAEDAFLYSNGQMTDLNTLIDPSLGWTLYTANGINDSGEITGIGFIDGQAQRHAFLLSPFSGSLTVSISPAAAVIAGAMWNVDGGSLQTSGTTISGLPVGQHTVSFNNVIDWNTPANQTANITNGQPTSLTGAYVQQTGSLTVAISPAAAVSAGAQWNVDGGPWQTSGATVSAAVGSHTVNFNTIAGWSAPASQTVNITNGQTTSATGLYVQQYGALTVMIGPAAAVSAGAQWNVDGGSWQLNGATVSAAVGSHTINFFTITGWTSPASQTVNIVNLQTTSASGAYIQQFGSLTVTITPAAAVSAGAQWNVDGGSWQTSGTTISGLTVGQHTVAFNNITGWNTPASQTVTIANGQTTAAGGAYEQLTDSLKVTIGPLAAVHAGAQWQVDGGVWQNSGVTANGLTYGRHVVGFKEIQGWKAPADQTVTIAKGKTTTSIGTYLQLPVVLKYKISNGAASSITRQVTLNNQTSGNPTKYMASESQDFIGAVWQTYSDDPKFTLSAGGGIKTVYFKVENRAGESGVASDAIQLIVPPTVTSFEINNGATATSSRTVTLDNTATESPTYYMASQSSTFIGAIWKPYAAAPAFTLSSGNGTKTVYFKVKNAAGASKVVSETITLD